MTTTLQNETAKAKRSTVNGDPQTHPVAGTRGYYSVPSFYARTGCSIDEAARSLGLRVLTRRETGIRDDVLAEIHETGVGASRSFLCVARKAG